MDTGPDTELPAGHTRDRLTAAAVELFTRHSFAGTSLQMIADELGFTKAAIYHHFRTRDQLLLAVLEPLFAELTAAKADGNPDAMKALKARFETARSRRNLDAVVDWERRWRRMREQIAATAPDVIALQELDRAEDVQRDLAAMGYTMSYTPSGWG